MADPVNPPAIVRPAEDYTEEAILRAMKALRKGMILDRQAYGIWLGRLKARVGAGRWAESCRKIGLLVRTADRWIERSAQATPIPDDLAGMEQQEQEYTLDTLSRLDETTNPQLEASQQPTNSTPQSTISTPAPSGPVLCSSCAHRKDLGRPLVPKCENCKKAREMAKPKLFSPPPEPPNLGLRQPGDPEPPAAGQPVETGTPVTAPETGPAAGSGDAAEELPPGAILDPDGRILPAWIKEALEGAPGAEKARVLLREAKKEIKAFAETPAGVYLDTRFLANRIAAVSHQMTNRVLSEKNTFACDGDKGLGCTGAADCPKCAGKLAIPKPMLGDLGPKPKKKWYGKRR